MVEYCWRQTAQDRVQGLASSTPSILLIGVRVQAFVWHWLLNLRPDLALQELVKCGVPPGEQGRALVDEGKYLSDALPIVNGLVEVDLGLTEVLCDDCGLYVH